MSEVKRYSMYEPNYFVDEYIHPKMEEDKNGDYVLYSDYEKLKAQLERAEACLNFYSNSNNYNIRHIVTHVDGIHGGICSDIHFDGGKRAREYFKEKEQV